MSELHIKRQAIRKDIRRKQIFEYMNRCRQQLVSKHPVMALEVLTPKQLDAIYNELERQNYNASSLTNFLQTVKNRNTTSFNQPALFIRLKYILQYIEDQQQKAIAKKMVQNICQRVVAEGVRNQSFLENIFKQFIQLIGIEDFQLQTIWPSVGLIRNEIFFRISFNWFIEFIGVYNSDILGIIGPVIQTMLNFTIDLQKQEKMMLSNNQYLTIIDSIEKILQHYCLQLEEIEMSRIAFTIINVIKVFPIEEGLKIVKIKHLLVHLLKYVEKARNTEHFLKNYALRSILELIGLSLSGSPPSTTEIVQTNPKIFEILCKLLPIDVPFKKIQIPRPVQWTHQNNQIILRVMLSLNNLASNHKLCFEIIANGTFGLVVELSAYPSPWVKEQTAIFLWNMILTGQEELTSLLCDNSALYIICNALTAEHFDDSLMYSLKSLLIILQSASSFSSNSSFWHFSLPVIRDILLKSQTYRTIEGLCLQKNSKISDMAASCLDILQ